jgi:nucleotide-binding universal stress UspA family protein
MKKLLVLTDFTTNASHAEAVALQLSGKLGAGLLLYHTHSVIPLIASDGGGPYVAETATMLVEDSKETLSQEVDKLKMLAAAELGLPPIINYQIGEGDLADAIGELSAEPNVEMIIMGGSCGGAMEHLLIGSDTSTVIRKASKPVLIIPMNTDWRIPQKIAFATDFRLGDMSAVNFLLKLSSSVGAQLEVVHVSQTGEMHKKDGAELAFRKYLEKKNLVCTQLLGSDVQGELQHYCSRSRVDLLSMAHGRHSFFSRLFGYSESEEAISNKQLALLIFPADSLET